ncbi:MAG TPA: ABC transporter permease [Thermomicrobiales bacterium]|nr:ABC transporter permease [Thermomicrobiales bacterium]
MRAPGGRLANAVLGVYLALFFLFLFLPILMAVESSFNLDRFVGLPWKGFTLEWYRGIIDTPDVLPSLRRSIVVGLCVAAASVVLGFLAAYSLTRVTFPGKDVYVMAVISPIAVPWILLGLGFVIYFNSIGIPRSLFAVGISHTVFAAPLAMVMIRARLAAIPPSYQEAARDLGASTARSIVEVVLPLAAPAIVAAFLVAFTLSFDEFILAWFVSGFETTLPVKIWSMIRTGLTPTVSAIGVVIFAISITLTILAEWSIQRRTESGGEMS